jgi:hypothetical protein
VPRHSISKVMNRREFIIGSTAALLIAAGGGSYVFSSCPLDTEGTGLCTGPCSAFVDFDGDGFCDRLPRPAQVQVGHIREVSDTHPIYERACPYGLVDDPYPGECNLYIDTDGDGICDLSQERRAAAPDAEEASLPGPDVAGEPASRPSLAAATILTACPLGLVNDPYPGECRRYVDNNGNRICDLSEPPLIASGEIDTLPAPSPLPAPAPGVTPTARPPTACPYGLVNDPYPGECRSYVDNNSNGICDLSEPSLIASGAVALASTSTSGLSGNVGGQQRRRRSKTDD